MALRVSAKFVKIWEIKDSEYGKRVRLSTSRKDKRNDSYISTNWINVRFVGEAEKFLDECRENDVIEIVSGQLENVWNKEKRTSYLNMTVFEAKFEGEKKTESVAPEVITEEDVFPFK